MKTVIRIEPHLLASFLASEAACDVIDLLPDVDLVEQLKNLIYIQNDLLACIIDHKHYGTDNITNFIEFIHNVRDEISQIGEE